MDTSNVELSKWINAFDVGENIKLLGPRSDIPAVMNALDVHVLSSLGEAFPNVLAEAMACETPCVTTDVGDAAVIVAEHGWVVPPQNADLLGEALEKAYNDFAQSGAKWLERKAACRAHIVTNFELGSMQEKYRKAWQACMQN